MSVATGVVGDRRARALAAIPDTPATVEMRALCLAPDAVIGACGDGWFVTTKEGATAGVYGDADAATVAATIEALGFDGEVLVAEACTAVAAWLCDGWRIERAAIFTGGGAAWSVPPPRADLRVARLPRTGSLPPLPGSLADELEAARATTPVFAAWDGGAAASFAYVAWETERHGDLSVDTLEPWRRRGCARAVVQVAIDDLAARGKIPVWGALASNAASLALARSLGFIRPAGTLLVASRRR